MPTGPINRAKPQGLGLTAPTAVSKPAVTPSPAAPAKPFEGDPRAKKLIDPGELATAVPQRHVLDERGPSDAELTRAIAASIGIRSHSAELPTADEVRALEAQGKTVVFSQAALDEAKRLPDLSAEFQQRERIGGVTFSIDSYETTDLDNALSYRPGADGTHYVSVTGTDVSAWVRPGSVLDAGARRRAETRYLSSAGLVLPMLPLTLSEGKLSLFEGEPRLGKTVELHYGKGGELLGSRIYKSVVVNTHLSAGDAAEAREGRGRGATDPALAQALTALGALGARIQGSASGAVSIEKLTPLFTTTAATELGKALKAAGLETSYRNQEPGKKSLYDEKPIGHVSIGAEAYATFTGPMRRYADLDVQRAIDRLLKGARPTGKLYEIDHRMREVQHERMNGVVRDPRLRFDQEVIAATRKPAEQLGPPPAVPTAPPLAPEE
ncbi:MAG: RNB domain-containing ribonuclease [Myxococcaceae bacterium]|nr:RNB domain-containing ribonuclease [Myxococcaceae bacterium]